MENGRMLVRQMEPSDVKRVAELEQCCFSLPWSEKSLSESLEREEYIFVVAEADGEIAGYAGLVQAGDEGDITDVAVFPEFRRMNAGTIIMDMLLKKSAQRGICHVFLEVRESNLAARKLYEKLGFRTTGMRKNFYSFPVENAILMQWDADYV